MIRGILSAIFLFAVYASSYVPVYAIVDPAAVPNNKVGIHLAVVDRPELQAAAQLVNGSGGAWGYVTVVIQEDDRDVGKWQEAFNEMRRLKLIPIVRIATKPEGGFWRRPTPEDAQSWVSFFQQLNWVAKNRYVVLFNEPNHATEWGGSVDPEGYSRTVKVFAEKLKEAHTDYFVMLGGLDLSAPSQGTSYEDAGNFFDRMFSEVDAATWNSLIDGLASHAYPNPGFSGSPFDTGKMSIRGYEWELAHLASLGISKPLPVFITETGWRTGYLSDETVSHYMKSTYDSVWMPDSRVVAVTPFVLNYQTDPFLGFSWRKQNSSDYYPVYTAVRDMEKVGGSPVQEHSFTVVSPLPHALAGSSDMVFTLRVKNTGQSILDGKDGYRLVVGNLPEGSSARVSVPSQLLEPGQEAAMNVYITTGAQEARSKPHILLEGPSGLAQQLALWDLEIVPKISLKVLVQRLFGFGKTVDQYELQVFDSEERMVYRQADLVAQDSVIFIERVPNLAVGGTYRVVVLRPYYLPRQAFIVIQKEGNEVQVKRMLPLDPDKDGKFSLHDVISFVPNLYRYL